MKKFSKNRWFLLFLMCAGPVLSFSQDVTGIWRGYFISESGENYKLEFQVKQNASQVVSGVSYSYLDVRFYGKATMAGNFTKSSKNFRIREIRTVEIKSLGYGNTCIMNYNLTYSRSGKEEFLEGSYLGKTEVKSGENPYEWGECGGGKVFLRKVATSEFYVEPFLRKNTTNTPKTNTLPPAVNKNQPKQLTPPPVVKKENSTDPPATSNKPAPSVTEPPKRNIPPPVKTDTIAKIPAVPSPAPPPVAVPQVLKTRQNELIKTLVVNSPDVTLKIFDNGEIDDDSVSVYLDNKLVLSNKRLTTSPLTLKLKMDEENTDHEVVMVAENLGRIPPNTSLMIVEAGSQRFELRITSTEQKNAVIRFQYRKP